MDAVDIAALAQKLRGELAAAEAPAAAQLASVSSIIIAAVGELTRNVSPADYDPQHVSIGPYHCLRNPQLARDEEKVRSLGAVMSAASAAGLSLEVCLGELARLEGDARSCYAHGFAIDSSEFVRMLLLDAC